MFVHFVYSPDITYNSKTTGLARVEHFFLISTFNTHAPDIQNRRVGRVVLNIDKHYTPPFFQLLVRLKEKSNKINLINSICMQMCPNSA